MRVNNLKFSAVLLVSMLVSVAFIMPSSADEPVTESWVRTSDNWGRGEAVAVDSNDNIIVTGGHYDTIKYDKYGNEIWNTSFLGFWALGLAVDSEDNIVVAGYGGRSIQVVKFDPDGNELWNVTNPNSDTASGVAIDSNDNIIVIGYDHPPYPYGGTYNITVYKYDSDGIELWNLTYDSCYYDYGTDVAIDSSDNIIITGYVHHRIWHSISPPSYTDLHYYLTIKYTSTGTELWNVTFDAGNDIQEYAYGVEVDSDDNIIVTGYSPHSGTADFYTIKYDPNGNEVWNSSFDFGQEIANCIAIDSCDNIILAGEIYFSHSIYDYVDGIIVKLDPDGNELWNYTYNTGESNCFKGIAVDSKNNIVVVGYSENWSLYNPKFVTLKLTDDDSILNEIEDMLEDLDDYISSQPGTAFKNNPTNRKNAFSNKIEEVMDLIDTGEYENAIDKLERDIRAKADGSMGGNPRNDWVTDPDAQEDICQFVDDLISYLETLI
jgi:uncharacterized delta-60 repeat protein